VVKSAPPATAAGLPARTRFEDAIRSFLLFLGSPSWMVLTLTEILRTSGIGRYGEFVTGSARRCWFTQGSVKMPVPRVLGNRLPLLTTLGSKACYQ
jgi:hypothetical protein